MRWELSKLSELVKQLVISSEVGTVETGQRSSHQLSKRLVVTVKMSKNKLAYSEEEKIDLLERCREMFRTNKNIWGSRFFEDLAQSPGVSTTFFTSMCCTVFEDFSSLGSLHSLGSLSNLSSSNIDINFFVKAETGEIVKAVQLFNC